jgi:hypothetical protein
MRRVLLAWFLLLAGIGCVVQSANAFWQSRDSNYNASIVTGAALACTNASPVQVADNGLAYTGSIPSASGGTPTYTFSLTSGSLTGTGLSLSTLTGQITGTPLSAGTISGLRISVTDLALNTVTCGASFNIVVAATLTISYTPVQMATQGSLYTGATPSTSGGTGTITYSSTGTAPPTGITLNTSTGVFSGTPSGSGTTTGIILTATDSCNCSGNQTSSSSSFQIAVAAAPTITVTFSGGTNPNSTTTSVANAFTFASQPTGTSGIIGIGIMLSSCTTSCSISSVTVGGSSATQATGAAGGNTTRASDFWYIAAPGGSTETIVVTTGTATSRLSIVVYNITGTGVAFSTAAQNTVTASATVSVSGLVVPSSGATIGFAMLDGASGFTSASNLTQDASSGSCCGGNWVWSGHNTTLSGSNSFGITFASSGFGAGSFATFSP